MAQRTLRAHDWPDGEVLRVRMGLHAGVGEVHEGDYVGLAVHRAARIAAAAHGGQVLLSAATAERAGVLPPPLSVRSLGEFALKDFDEPTVILQLCHPELDNEFRPPRALPFRVHNVTRRRTSFVGRERELAALREQLRGTSMLTLVGPGGVGKTRLAQELVLELAGAFADGAYQVELAAISGDRVWSEVARALEVDAAPDEPLPDLLPRALQNRSLLLLLDNCEHVLDAIAELVDVLLGACHQLVIVATSRERIAVEGEAVFTVAPLAAPREGGTLTELRANDAVALLCDRAAAVFPEFEIDVDNADAIAAICRRLDGIPLALELAAGQLGVLGAQQVAVGLDRRFDTIVGGMRAAAPRQRTLEATIAWSYDLLTDEQGRTLRTLAVFASEFDVASARAVYRLAWDGGPPALADLAAKTLVARDGESFRLLESVRQYARLKRAEMGETEQVRRGYLGWIADIVAQRPGEELTAYFSRLERSYSDIRAGLDWAERAGCGAELVAVCARGGRFLVELHRIDGRRWMEAALGHTADADPGEVTWVKARLAFARGISQHDDTDPAIALGLSALAEFEAADDVAAICETCVILTGVFTHAADFKRALEHGRRAVAIAEAHTLNELLWTAHGNLGLAALAAGVRNEARRHFEAALATADDPYAMASLRISLAYHDLLDGDIESALERLFMALPTLVQVGSVYTLRESLALIGCARVRQQRYEEAARVLAAVYAFRGYRDSQLDREAAGITREAVATLHAHMDPTALADAWRLGESLTLEQACDAIFSAATHFVEVVSS